MPDYLGTTVFVAFDGDHIGREVGRASLADDVVKLRRLSQDIERGNALWGSWALASLGTVVSLGGDEGRLEVPAHVLGELHSLRAQYHGAVGASCSVGVGLSLSEADKALLYAKFHGGDRVCFFSADMDDEIQEIAQRQNNRGEVTKLADEYLDKAEASGPGQPQPQVSAASISGSQGQQAAQTIQAGAARAVDAPSAPAPAGETTAEQRLHAHAQKQKQQDTATAAVQAQQGNRDAMKQQVVKVLQQVKAAAPLLEEARSQAPEIYKAMLGAIKAMTDMARELTGGTQPAPEGQQQPQETQKSEAQELRLLGLDKAETNLEKMACIHDDAAKPMTVYRVQNAAGEGPYWGAFEQLHAAGLTNPSPRRPDPRKDFSNDYQASKELGDPSKGGELSKLHFGFERPEHAEQWFGRAGMNKLRMAGFDVVPVKAARVHRSMTGKQVVFDPADVDPARKAELPMPAVVSAKPHLDLPVGSTQDGRVKVRHADGRSGWVEVRAGMVMSPDGHPISSRNPGGR